MLDRLIKENLSEKEREHYQNILDAPYPPSLLETLQSGFNLDEVLSFTGKTLSLLLAGIIIASFATLYVACRVSRVAHHHLSQALGMEEQRLFIIEINAALLALILLSL